MTTAEILEAIKGLSDQAQREYLRAIRYTVDAATYAEVERLLAANDQAGLEDYLMPVGLGAVFAVLGRAFIAGAQGEQQGRPLGISVVRSTWPRERDDALERLITQDQREALNRVITVGRGQGRTDAQIARDLLGVPGATGSRSGGTVGTSDRDALTRLSVRSELERGDLRAYLRRKLRDPVFDALVLRAIDTGRVLSANERDRIERAYAVRLLDHRARVVAETEAHARFEGGRFESYGGIRLRPGWRLEKTWITVGDERVRHSHRPMNRQRQPVGEPFISGRGRLLNFPGDMSLGAGYDETAGCRCHAEYRIRKGG